MRALATAVGMTVLLPLTAYAGEPGNQPPAPVPDFASVVAGESVTIHVLANDIDDGLPQPLQVVAVDEDPRVTFDAATVTFAAGPQDQGQYTVGYTVSDGDEEASSTITVTVDRPQTSVSLSLPATVVGLQPFRVWGKVIPARAVRVVLHRRIGAGPWREVARTTSDAAGRFRFTQKAVRLAPLRYYAAAGAHSSAVVTRRVAARPQVTVSGPLAARDVPFSYRPGCPVGPSSLRRITITHLSYGGVLKRGRVVVSASAVPAVQRMLTKALAARFPFRQLVPADRFYDGGRRTPTQSDLAAMRADNTSAFNCRAVTGNPYRLSQHSYGNAIDINTVRNPYVTASHVYPSFARTYLNRGWRRPGMLFHDGVVATALRNAGWLWGARWAHPDYQHFSSNGG
ncbi:MAG TPA: M15 family metallopeptidase [Nocardioidaceae bacterium]|nr:M15 family metallopeptidase [Nocardioidaceae bacterium]